MRHGSSVEYCQLLARYNRWMNERLYAVVDEFSEEERTRDRGAFFGSMHRTLNHILWGDRIWLSRFTKQAYTSPAFGADLYADFAELTRERDRDRHRDPRLGGELTSAWLAGRSSIARPPTASCAVFRHWVAATHMFQHATHHRGQLTTLIKQAGRDTGVTDLPFMPGVVKFVD